MSGIQAVLNGINRNVRDQKNYFYQKEDISLGFTLFTDTRKPLKVYRELLKLALADVEEDINNFGKK